PVNAFAESPVHLEPSVENALIDLEKVPALLKRAAQRTTRLTRQTDGPAGIRRRGQLPHVIEADLGLRLSSQSRSHVRVRREIAQQTVADAAIGDAAQLLLDGLESLARGGSRIEP